MSSTKSDKEFNDVAKKIKKYIVLSTTCDEDLDSEPFISNQQKKRDIQTTNILTAYVSDYQIRVKRNRTYRGVLFWGCSTCTFLIILVSIVLLFRWIPIITGQYENAEQQLTQIAQTEEVNFEQVVKEANSLITTATEETDYAQLAASIGQMLGVSSDQGEQTTIKADMSVRNVVSLITVCITLLGAILGLLKIIAEYVFQKDEEKNVIDIVKSLQQNDYEHVRTVLETRYGKNTTETKTPAKPS
jgi:hypothetical protein